MSKAVNILEWRWKNGIKPVYHWAKEQDRRDWEKANKQSEDAEMIRRILLRGTIQEPKK